MSRIIRLSEATHGVVLLVRAEEVTNLAGESINAFKKRVKK